MLDSRKQKHDGFLETDETEHNASSSSKGAMPMKSNSKKVSVAPSQTAKTVNPMSTRSSRLNGMRARSETTLSGLQARTMARPKASSESSGSHSIRKRVMRKNVPKKDVSSSSLAMLRREEEYLAVPPLPPPGEGIPLKPVFVLIGPPGTGKHTQASHIAELLQLVSLTEHDLLVELSKKKGISAAIDFSKVGEDDVGMVLDIIQDTLHSARCLEFGMIVEGFPRTVKQAEAFHNIVGSNDSYTVAGILVLEASEKIVLERACGRWLHKASGRAYHKLFHPPKSLVSGVEVSPKTMLDDITGDSLEPVDENTKSIIKEKFAMFQQDTPRMLDFFALVEMQIFRIAVNYYKMDDDIWGEIVPIVLTQASSLQPRKNLPPFVPNTTDRQAVKHFALWALDNWDHLYMLFEVPEQKDPDSANCRTVGFEEFGEYVRNNGFAGDAKRIFRLISAEGPVGATEADQVSLAQVKRFSRRKSVIDAAVKDTKRETELGTRFVKLLRYQHGTALRGWRLDVDLRGSGNVDYSEFCRACSRMGLAEKAKSIWACFRPIAFDAVPLTLQDIAQAEYDQVMAFMEFLQRKVDFDLDEAWKRLDTKCKGYLTTEEFEKGVADLGFEGDAQLIFRGLDTPGLGKLWRHELDYFHVLRKAPSRGKQKEKRNRSLEFRPTVRPLIRAAAQRVAFSERPDWDGTVDMTWRKNLEHQAHQRAYFSDLKVKPVRSEIHRKLADTAERVAQEREQLKAMGYPS